MLPTASQLGPVPIHTRSMSTTFFLVPKGEPYIDEIMTDTQEFSASVPEGEKGSVKSANSLLRAT